MAIKIVAAFACLLLVAGSAEGARLLNADASVVAARSRQLQQAGGLNQSQALGLLKLVADLVQQISDVGVATKLDDAIDEAALLNFLKEILAGLGVKNSAIDTILNGDELEKALTGQFTDTTIAGAAKALQTLATTGSVTQTLQIILEGAKTSFANAPTFAGLANILNFNKIFKGLGLPLDGTALNKAVNVTALGQLEGDVLLGVLNGLIQLVGGLGGATSATGGSSGALGSLGLNKVLGILG